MVLCGASLLAVATAVRTARADEKSQCLDAAAQAQSLRDAHKLTEALDQLRVCAEQSCPAAVQKDCSTWFDEVQQSVPTVVLSAKDGAGRDLFDFTVTVDGQPMASKAAGEAVAIDPGPHTFVFKAQDGTSVEQKVLVREGIKNQPVAVVLGNAGPAPDGTASAGAAQQAAGSAPSAADSGASSGFPMRTVGWVAGGAGVVGLGLGAVFGLVAMGDKSGANCDANNVCHTAGSLESAKSAATVSTVGFVVGGVLLAGGAALVLLGPPSHPQGTAASPRLELAPMVGTREAGLGLGGAW
jgi:hypothetical protein